MNKMTKLPVRWIALLAGALALGSSAAQAGTHPSGMREFGSGFRVQLFDRVTGQLLANKEVEIRKVFSDPRRPHVIVTRRTNENGVVRVVNDTDVVKAVFYFDGIPGALGAVKLTDTQR